MADVKVRFSSDTTGVSQGVSKVQGSINGLKGSLGGLGVSGLISGLAGVFASMQALRGLGTVLGDSVTKAAGFETLSVSLEVLTGNAQTAKKLIKEITEYGASTPLEQTDLQDVTKTLLSFGVEVGDVMNVLKLLGDVSMGNAEKLKGLALVYGQVSASGRLMGGDVLQMVNNGFNPLLNISKRLNLSMVETKEKMEAGEISVSMLRQSFSDATSQGAKFYGMLSKNANTMAGKLSNTKDALDQLQVTFGTGLNEGLKKVLDTLNAGLPKLAGLAQSLGQDAGDVVAKFSNAFNNGEFKEAIWNGFNYAVKQLYIGLVAVSIYAGEKFATTVLDRMGDKLGIPKGPESETGKLTSSMLQGVLFPLTMPKAFGDIQKFQNGESLITKGDSFADVLADTRNSLEPLLNSAKNLEEFNKAGKTPAFTGEGLKGTTIKVSSEEWKKLIDQSLSEIKAASENKNTIQNLKDAFSKGGLGYFFGNNNNQEKTPEWLTKRIKDNKEKPDALSFMEPFKPVLSSLARIGGATAFTKNPLVNLQKRANEYLERIAVNTGKTRTGVAVWS